MHSILKKRHLIVYLASLFISHNLYSQQNLKRDQPDAALPLDPAVRTGKLANGFTYFIRRNTNPEKRVVFYIVNKVGSVLEKEDQRGLAHFLEHMNFNGTTHYPKNELISYLERSGVAFGADLNAYTNFNETVYQLPLPSDDPELLKNGLQIMRDWAHGALLEPAEIDRERGVILEEKRMRSGFDQRLLEKSLPMSLNNSIYSRRLPIGTEQVLTTFKPAQIKSFYDQWYRPDLQALIVVGDIDPARIEKSVRAIFSDLKNPAKEQQRQKISIPLTGDEHFLKYTDAEAPDSRITISYKFRSPMLRTRSDYREKILRSLVDQLLTFRFNDLNQREGVPYQQAGAGTGNYLADLDVFNFSVTLKPQHAEAGFKSAFTEMERIGRYGFTATELDRVKKTYMAGIKALILEKDKNKSANYVEEYVNYFLNQEAAPGLETEFKLTGEFLPGITLAEVNRKTAGFLSLRDQDILVTGPKTIPDDLPDERTLKQWIDEVKKAPLSAYLENNLNAVLMKDEPVKGKVAAVSNVSALNAAIYRLDNGIQLVFKPTTFKNDGVLFYSYKKGGTSLAADPDYHSAVNAAALVKAGGVANLTANQLAKLLSGRKLSVSPYINELYEGFSGSFGAEDMETAFQLIHQYHVSPRKDTTVFKNILANAKIAVANRHNDPEAVFSDSVNAVLGDYSIRRTPPALADIAGIDQDKALRFYRERWDNVNGETFVFVGNFDPEKLLNYCETYLGSLPADTGSAESFKDLKIVVPAGIATHIFNKGKEAKSEVKLVFSGKYDYSLASNLQLQALGAIVELRLLDRLRESEGGVYTPQAGATFAKYPSQQYQIAVDFTCAPGNTDKLIHATLEEIENLKTNGISASDLEKFKAETLRNNEVRVKTDAYWLGYLVRQMSNKEDLLEADQVVTMINALDRDTLQKAAKKYISGDNLQRFILNPEKPN